MPDLEPRVETEWAVEWTDRPVPPIRQTGRFSGRGTLTAQENGLTIQGDRTSRDWKRLAPSFAFFAAAIVSLAMWPTSALPIAFLVAGLFSTLNSAEPDEVTIPWGSLRRVAVDEKAGFVAIEFEGASYRTPAVARTQEWRDIVAAIEDHAPGVLVPGNSYWRESRRALLALALVFGGVVVCLAVIGMLFHP